jgi:hypothetical protein
LIYRQRPVDVSHISPFAQPALVAHAQYAGVVDARG